MQQSSAKCLKYSVFTFNFIFFIAGVLLLTCGFMAMKMSSEFTKIIESVEQLSLVNKALYLVILSGGLLTIIGFFGCYGALRENKCLLSLFFTIIFVILVIELTAGTIIFLNASEARQFVNQSLNIYRYSCDQTELRTLKAENSTVPKFCTISQETQQKKKGGDGENNDWIDNLITHDWKSGEIPVEIIQIGAPVVQQLWDNVHELFQCCGINGISDWTTFSNQTRFFGKIPKTCCSPESRVNETIIPTNSSEQFLFEFCPDDGEISNDYGCGDRINVYSNLLLSISVSAGFVQIVALGVSCLLCRNIGDLIKNDRRRR
ncbi:Oidioi.mRNA.OKI2018_I69.chr2.g4610.t1.cds [Oikopleura dioica]|uniref:Oidioi.mRNA.OKI2018_I69.chr2.g4610.t1.cds n=1 Tax=Oikopleura dioica TaxID=34765 RepID=A0ABN7T3G5_OIKDI|nr:Oidioi.mRNA.OKI2018_I69.chr2.g4610.t1.cds [Oikopleura dioica]